MENRDLGVFLDYFGRIHQRTMRVVRCAPPDKMDWSFREGKFSIGDLARHIATSKRYLFAETLDGRPSRYAGCGRELAPTLEETLLLMDTLHRESLEIISGLTDLKRECRTPDGAVIATWKWMRAMVEHEIHHRGQVYTYLALLDVPTPPLFGLTSEQVLERSKGA
jgi:uncharacterized damage-inducible protein DinB